MEFLKWLTKLTFPLKTRPATMLHTMDAENEQHLAPNDVLSACYTNTALSPSGV